MLLSVDITGGQCHFLNEPVTGQLVQREEKGHCFILHGQNKNLMDRFKAVATISDFKKFVGDECASFVALCLNKDTGELYIGREYSGTWPLYYVISDGVVYLSDNLFELSAYAKGVDERSCFQFLYFEYPKNPSTYFENVKSVPNGAVVRITADNKSETVQDNFELPNAVIKSSEEMLASQLRDEITKAHERRIAESGNAVFVSGGLDSQVMSIALVKDLRLQDVKGLHFSIEGAEETEWRDAQKVCGSLGMEFVHHIVDPNKEINLREYLARSSSPYLGSVFISELLQKATKSGDVNTVFAGQDTRLHTPALSRIDLIYWSFFSKGRPFHHLFSPIAAYVRGQKKSGAANKRQRLWGLAAELDRPGRFLAKRSFHAHDFDFLHDVQEYEQELDEIAESLMPSFCHEQRGVYNHLVQKNWRRQYLFDIEYMVGVSRTSGINCEMPFYDRDLSRFSAQIPFSIATRHTYGRASHSSKKIKVNKYLLRKAYEDDLDFDLIYRDKAVCRTNYLFLNGGLKGPLEELLADAEFFESDFALKYKLPDLRDIIRGKHGKWRPEDNSLAQTVLNLLFVHLIMRQVVSL
ncbi:MAG: hypothetical protein CMF31_02140 [Kordiimonas sp.]|nr:hypothetical protein [Kordiimonas sp.]|tara:strand:+ start:573 stop:2315 length:1743 start_codon:yes stop_codon:yes gene_type:complete